MVNEINKGTLRNLSALVDFSNLINSSLDTKFILNNLLLTCFGKFHTTRGLFATNVNGKLKFILSKGINEIPSSDFPQIDSNNYKDSSELK